MSLPLDCATLPQGDGTPSTVESPVAQTPLPPAVTFEEPLVVTALPQTACVRTSPVPGGAAGWLPGRSTSMALPSTRTGLPATVTLSEVCVAELDEAT